MSSTPSAKKKSKCKSEDADDIDIYQNLPEFEEYDSKLEKLRLSNESLLSKLKELESKVETLTKTNHKLSKIERALSRNISVLFTTAITELQSKDQMIVDLRKERDSLIFRRYQRSDQNTGTALHSGVLVQQVIAQPREAQSVSTDIVSSEKSNKPKQDDGDYNKRHSKDTSKLKSNSEKYNNNKSKSRNHASRSKSSREYEKQSNSFKQDYDKKSSQNTNIENNSSNSDLETTIIKSTGDTVAVNSRNEKSLALSLYNAAKDSQRSFLNSKDSLFKEKHTTKPEEKVLFDKLLTDDETEKCAENISQRSFRIPKLKHSDKEVAIVSSSILHTPEDAKDASQSNRYRIKPPEEFVDDEAVQKPVNISNSEKLNICVDASLTSSTECVFSFKRKSRIKILNVSREDDKEEVVEVANSSTKRACPMDSEEIEPPEKVLCLGLKEQSNSGDDGTKSLSNKDESDHNEQKQTLGLDSHDDLKGKNNDNTEKDANSGILKQHKKREDRIGNHCHNAFQEEDKTTRRRHPNESPSYSKRSRDVARHAPRYHNRRKESRDYRRRSRSFSSDVESDHARHSKSRRNARHEQIRRSPSVEKNTLRGDRKSTVGSNIKKSDTSDLDMLKERNKTDEINNCDINNHKSSNLIQSSPSESPDCDAYLKTYLSDDYFSEDEKSLGESSKKSKRKKSPRKKSSFSSRHRSRSMSSSDNKHYNERRSYRSRKASPRRRKMDAQYEEERRSRHNQRSYSDLRDKLKKSCGKDSEIHGHENNSAILNDELKQVTSQQVFSSLDKNLTDNALPSSSCLDVTSISHDVTNIASRKSRKQILNLQLTSTIEDRDSDEDNLPNDSSKSDKSVDEQSKCDSDLEEGEITD